MLPAMPSLGIGIFPFQEARRIASLMKLFGVQMKMDLFCGCVEGTELLRTLIYHEAPTLTKYLS